MFNWFSLDVIYYPVSAIMWLWYKVFGFVFGPDNFFAWALTVMFLVFTLRAILYKPFVRQIRTTRQMQELQPQIKALQKKYGKDRQRMALEMQKLQKDHGFNPILGCLPMLAQIPVFLGLYHVLMSFNRTQTGIGRLGLSVAENSSIGNYVFSATDVQNFLKADLFGAPLGASMVQTVGLGAFEQFDRIAVIIVGVPLMILAGVATHFNSRASVARQSIEASANPQTAMMNKLALYVFPLGVVVGGPFLPLAIILYWVSNNIWTYGQQHLVFGRIEKEEEAKKREELARRASNAPAPGTKPKRKRPTTSGAGAEGPTKPPVELTDHDGDELGADDAGSTDATSAPLGDSPPTSNGKGPATKADGGANRGPRRANSRPKKRRP
ncbi:MAG: YidC/Oxa1 family rane protein insertase [Mycobacterium sp.]|nr:YidC/Oxa1 family rane protein insertase [Mycobacterium sp.]